MNANPSSSSASVAPALQSAVVRAPERARAVVTTLETFLSASPSPKGDGGGLGSKGDEAA